MTSARDQIIAGTTEAAGRARAQAGRALTPQSKPSMIRPGIVAAATAGSYSVDLVGANATTVETLVGVPAWGSATFDEGDQVWVVWVGDRPIPYLLGAGGGALIERHGHTGPNDGGIVGWLA